MHAYGNLHGYQYYEWGYSGDSPSSVEGVETMRLTVETDLFNHQEVKAHFINPCCFGEDFASWLKQQLQGLAEIRFEVSEPIQEDYGWGLHVNDGEDRFRVAVSYVGDGPQIGPVQWIVSVTHDPGLNLVKRMFYKANQQPLEEQIRKILLSNSALKVLPGTDE